MYRPTYIEITILNKLNNNELIDSKISYNRRVLNKLAKRGLAIQISKYGSIYEISDLGKALLTKVNMHSNNHKF